MIVSSKIRWFAVATGCLTGIAGVFGFGLGFAIFPGFLIAGALVQPRFPRAGRGLICFGALWLSFWVFDIGYFTLTEKGPMGRFGVAVAFSVLLVALCDLALMVEELKIRRTEHAAKRVLTQSPARN